MSASNGMTKLPRPGTPEAQALWALWMGWVQR